MRKCRAAIWFAAIVLAGWLAGCQSRESGSPTHAGPFLGLDEESSFREEDLRDTKVGPRLRRYAIITAVTEGSWKDFQFADRQKRIRFTEKRDRYFYYAFEYEVPSNEPPPLGEMVPKHPFAKCLARAKIDMKIEGAEPGATDNPDDAKRI